MMRLGALPICGWLLSRRILGAPVRGGLPPLIVASGMCPATNWCGPGSRHPVPGFYPGPPKC
eukprot:8715459-Karenia_brevis.AAC.1